MGRVATVLLLAGERNTDASLDSDVGTVEAQLGATSAGDDVRQSCPRSESEDDEVWEDLQCPASAQVASSSETNLDKELEIRTPQLPSNDISGMPTVEKSNSSADTERQDIDARSQQTESPECNADGSELRTEVVVEAVGEDNLQEQVLKTVEACTEYSASSEPSEAATVAGTVVVGSNKQGPPVLKPLDLKQPVKNYSELVEAFSSNKQVSERSASEVSSEEPMNEKWFLTFEEFISAVQQEPELCQFFAEQSTIDLAGSSVDPVLNPYTRTVLATSPLS